MDSSSHEMPTTVGPYQLIELLGEGGMGVVYRARQTKPIIREVALKLVKAGMDTKQVLARFEAERQALAVMDHPSIAKVYEAGETDKGRPYFVMELVAGTSLTEYCSTHRLSLNERLQLFMSVCQAVQHAHQKGIVHRDLKPANILVTEIDGCPTPHIIDFGIAKAMERRLTDLTLDTNYAHLLGTSAYMSPEQADLSSIDVDTRSDIYALGVLLYELVTGSLPLDSDALESAVFSEVQRMIWEEEPLRPSKRLTEHHEHTALLSESQSISAPKLIDRVRGDLDWIIMKALEKDRTQRYDTTEGLFKDVRCFLQNEPVSATPPSPTYRAKKFVRRHRIGVAFASVVGLLVLTIATISTWQAIRIRAHAEASRQSLVRLVEANGLRHLENHDLYRALPWFVEALKVDAGQPARETIHRKRIASISRQAPKLVRDWIHPNGNASEVLFSRDGQRLYVRHGNNGEITVLNTLTGDQKIVVSESGRLDALKLSPDGTKLAGGFGHGFASLWDAETFQFIHKFPHPGGVRTLSFSPDGQQLLTGGDAGSAILWDIPTGNEIVRLEFGAPIRAVAISPGDETLIVAGESEEIALWKAPSYVSNPRIRKSMINKGVHSLSFDSSGMKLLASGQQAFLIDLETGKSPTRATGINTWLHGSSLCPDGRQALYFGRGSHAKLRSTDTDADLVPPMTHNHTVRHGTFSFDGNFVLTASEDTAIRQWDSETGSLSLPPLYHREPVTYAAYSPDKIHVVSSSPQATRLWRLTSGTPSTPVIFHKGASRAQFNESVSHLIVVDRLSRVRRYDLLTGEDQGDVSNIALVSIPLLYENGRSLVDNLSDEDRRLKIEGNTLTIVDSESGEPLSARMEHQESIETVRISPDHNFLITGSADKTARVWDATTGRLVTSPLQTGASVNAAVFSPDGNRVALFGDGDFICVYDLSPDNRPLGELEALSGLLSGRQIDPLQGMTVLPPQGRTDESARKSLIRSYPSMEVTPHWAWNQALFGMRKLAGLKHYESVVSPRNLMRPPASDVGMDPLLRQHPTIYWKRLMLFDSQRKPLATRLRKALTKTAEADDGGRGSFSLGTADLALGDYEPAQRRFQRVIESNPAATDAWEKLAIAYHHAKDTSNALTAIDQAIATNPHAADLHKTRAELHSLLGQWPEAIEDYQKAAQARLLVFSPQPFSIPPRSPEAPSETIDLTSYLTRSLGNLAVHDDFPNHAINEGVQEFGSIVFDVRGAIRLAPTSTRAWPLPTSVSGIRIQRPSKSLHLLYALAGTPNRRFGSVIVTYEDLTTDTIRLDHSRPSEDQKTQSYEASSTPIYQTTWQNPKPETRIAHLSISGASSQVSLIVFAITID